MASSLKLMVSSSIFPQLTTQPPRVLSRHERPEVLSYELLGASQVKSDLSQHNLSPAKAQEIICRFFIEQVKQDSPESVLQSFKDLFIKPTVKINSTPRQALEQIAVLGQKETFVHTLKRSIYILVNNWNVTRNSHCIHELVQLLSQDIAPQKTDSLTFKRFRLWRNHFVNSQDYEDLKIFVSKSDKREKPHWSKRYSSYRLVSQAIDSKKLPEQREAARTRYLQLKEQFKFELAMYTARTPSATSQPYASPNPTALGDEVLQLIETILLHRAPSNYASWVRVFLQQTQQLSYKSFKQSLIKYLLFSLDDQDLAEAIKTQLSSKLEVLYKDYHEQEWDAHLLLRTCNRVIEYLTTVNQEQPSPLFLSLATQGKTLTLAILLLKIVLLCPQAATHLEWCLAQLLQHYESQSEGECQWLIRFLEVLQVTLVIYTENVRFNLLDMAGKRQEISASQNGNGYRIFSQIKREKRKVRSAA